MDKLSALLRPQFLVYVTGGVLSALIDIGTMQLLLNHGAAAVPAASGGFFVSLIFNYLFHSKVTFGEHPSLRFVLRYGCVIIANYLLTVTIVALGDLLGISAIIAKIASLPLVAVNGFLLNKYWVFK